MMKLLIMLAAAACGSAPPSTPAPPAPAKPAPASEADALAAYQAKQWPRCAELYEAVAETTSGKPREDALYNGACCHAQARQSGRAFALLDRAVAGGMKGLEHIKQDEDLESLRGDSRWQPLLTKIEANVTKWEASLGDPALRRELLALKDEDQKARMAIIRSGSDDPSKEQIDALTAIDAKTTARMKSIIYAKGWLGFKLVGKDGASAAWLLVQHADADVAFQKECLALLEKAVAAGDAEAQHHAYLYDRVAVAEHRPQRYGTQFADGVPQPIEDEANVDARRKAVGLGTMAEYHQQMRAMYGDPKK